MKITEIREGKKNKNRVNIYSEGEFVCAVYLETAIKNNICCGADISHEAFAEIMKEDECLFAFNKALGYISYRMRSEREVRDKLKKEGLSASAADSASEKLKELGYIDDYAFARAYVQELEGNFGKTVIEQKLFMKGIGKGIVKSLTEGLEQSALAYEWAKKLRDRYKNDEPGKARQKVFRSMLTRGFSWDDIKKAVSRAYDNEGGDYDYE